MKVYVVVHVHSNGVDGWECIHQIYSDETVAGLEAILRQEEADKTNEDMCSDSFHVKEYELH